ENDTDSAAFWEALGGKGPITSAADAAKAAEKPVVEKALIRLTDRTEGAKLSYKVEATNGSIKKSQLDSNDVFIVDNSDHVYVWVGSNSTDAERKNAMKFATDYLAAHSRPLSLPVTRVVEGVEDRVPSFVACLA
ncbi:hypothetical protein HDU99_004019, partial [Rhizoclosmatium hyalinum]